MWNFVHKYIYVNNYMPLFLHGHISSRREQNHRYSNAIRSYPQNFRTGDQISILHPKRAFDPQSRNFFHQSRNFLSFNWAINMIKKKLGTSIFYWLCMQPCEHPVLQSCITLHKLPFISLAPGRCAIILKAKTFKWIIQNSSWALAVKLLSGECHRTTLRISQYWFR